MLKSNENYGEKGNSVPISPRVYFCLSKNIKLRKDVSVSKEDSLKIKQFSRGYDLEFLTKEISVESLILREGPDYATGIIKRYKDENLFKKNFTLLRKYNKKAVEYLNFQKN